MGVGLFELLILAALFVCPVVLGVVTTYFVVRWSRKPWLWALTPVFVLLWVGCGMAPLAGFALPSRVAPAPRPVTPAPPPVVETEAAHDAVMTDDRVGP